MTRLPFTVSGKDGGMIFHDKYDKIWFQEGNRALIYYDPLNKSDRRFTFPNQNAIGNFEVQDAGEQGMFFLTPGGEILLFDREKLEMVRINQLKPFSDDLPGQLFFHLLLDKDGHPLAGFHGQRGLQSQFPEKTVPVVAGGVSRSFYRPVYVVESGNTCALSGAERRYMGGDALAGVVPPGT